MKGLKKEVLQYLFALFYAYVLKDLQKRMRSVGNVCACDNSYFVMLLSVKKVASLSFSYLDCIRPLLQILRLCPERKLPRRSCQQHHQYAGSQSDTAVSCYHHQFASSRTALLFTRDRGVWQSQARARSSTAWSEHTFTTFVKKGCVCGCVQYVCV